MAELPFPGTRLVATAAEVNAAYDRLAAAIQPLVMQGHCVLLGVLMGGMVPLVQVASRLRGDFFMDYCHLTRYGGAASGGEIRWVQRPQAALRGQMVVLVDDIFDQGFTLGEARRQCLAAGAGEVKVAVLVHKRHARARADLHPDFTGLETGDEFLFGCGMDYRGRWRQLDAIYAVTTPG